MKRLLGIIRSTRSQADRGMATAEMAVALPILLIVVTVGIGAVSLASAQVRAQDAAAQAARSSARGDDATATVTVRRIAPGSTLGITRDGPLVTALVTLPVRPAGRILPAVTLRAIAVAAAEPTAPP